MSELTGHYKGFTGNSTIALDSVTFVQQIAPPDPFQRFEGVAFSPSGNIVGVATSDTNTVFLFRRKPDGQFEDAPYATISGPGSGLNYPHDLSFSENGGSELFAVANRTGSISIYEKNRTNDEFCPEPVVEICGAKTKLRYSDGVSFVPPDNLYLAACNLETDTISFYRKVCSSPVGFRPKPVFLLKHRSICSPDGLAFSSCGEWLAVANHGNHTISVFRRRNSIFSKDKLKYGRKPVSVIEDPGLRHPHSIAFTPMTNHLVVTNAGANYFSVYAPDDQDSGMLWSQTPVLRQTIGPDNIFEEVNARNKVEGGPKGLAIHKNHLAVCSPEHGVKIYSFREKSSSNQFPMVN